MSETVRPCPWMRRTLLRLAEGRKLGCMKLYAMHHLKKCKQCTATYRALLELRKRLRSAGNESSLFMSPDRWDQIENACRAVDSDRES